MIRERVSTSGVIRSLEPPESLPALNMPPSQIGVLSELSIRRYLDGKAKFDRKFKRTFKDVDKARHKTLEKSKRETIRSFDELQIYMQATDEKEGKKGEGGIKEALKAVSGSWSYAWALDESDEIPPPSSIIARRDVRRLAFFLFVF